MNTEINNKWNLPLCAEFASQTVSSHGDSMLQDEMQKSRCAQMAVEKNAGDSWKEYCVSLIKEIAVIDSKFTSDTVMIAMKEHPHDPRALGPAMRAARKMGYIRPTNEYKPSIRRHATPIRVWESLLIKSDNIPIP